MSRLQSMIRAGREGNQVIWCRLRSAYFIPSIGKAKVTPAETGIPTVSQDPGKELATGELLIGHDCQRTDPLWSVDQYRQLQLWR